MINDSSMKDAHFERRQNIGFVFLMSKQKKKKQKSNTRLFSNNRYNV